MDLKSMTYSYKAVLLSLLSADSIDTLIKYRYLLSIDSIVRLIQSHILIQSSIVSIVIGRKYRYPENKTILIQYRQYRSMSTQRCLFDDWCDATRLSTDILRPGILPLIATPLFTILVVYIKERLFRTIICEKYS